MFDKALEIALKAHMGKRDKGGKCYILHPLRVAMRLRTNDEELMCIAVLHDAVEDSSLTLADLTNAGFSDRITIALEYLTHLENESYEDYIHIMRRNLDALLVKREDLRDNSDITRLKGITDKDVERMAKYQRAFVQVEEFIAAQT